MGILSENEHYRIRILPKSILQYLIPFKNVDIYGTPEAYNTAKRLLNKGYCISIEEEVFITQDEFDYAWIQCDLSDLEHKVLEI